MDDIFKEHVEQEDRKPGSWFLAQLPPELADLMRVSNADLDLDTCMFRDMYHFTEYAEIDDTYLPPSFGKVVKYMLRHNELCDMDTVWGVIAPDVRAVLGFRLAPKPECTGYFKIIDTHAGHNGFMYTEGENWDTLAWNPNGSCQPGGLYYTQGDIGSFFNYGDMIASVKPLGETYKDPETSDVTKWKAEGLDVKYIGRKDSFTALLWLYKQGARYNLPGRMVSRLVDTVCYDQVPALLEQMRGDGIKLFPGDNPERLCRIMHHPQGLEIYKSGTVWMPVVGILTQLLRWPKFFEDTDRVQEWLSLLPAKAVKAIVSMRWQEIVWGSSASTFEQEVVRPVLESFAIANHFDLTRKYPVCMKKLMY